MVKRQGVFSFICALAVMATLTFMPLSHVHAQGETAPGRDVTVRVMTYNIHAGIGSDGNFDIERIADTIRDSGAEIVGLQEVDVHWGYRSDFMNEIQRLGEELNMNVFFAPIYNMSPLSADDPRRRFGVAVLSKYPIVRAENHDIARLSTQDANPEPKPAPGFAETYINVKGAKVWFYVTHLDYRSDPTVRDMQVEDMLQVMSGHENKILVGDMNATPRANELQPLFETFQDAWAAANDGNGYTYSATSPVKRIDYILTPPGMPVKLARVIDTKASDHLPVIADVVLTRGE